jgi:HEAT repeat protein
MLGSLFGSPDIKKMKEKGDVDGLIKALQYTKEKIGTANFGNTPLGAAEALGILGDTKAVLPLINALDSWHPLMFRNSIFKALGLLKDERAVLPLLRVLQKREPRDFSVTLIWAFARLRNPQTVGPLIEILKDRSYKNQSDRGFAGAALSIIGSVSVEPLINLAKSDSAQYDTVTKILGEIRDTRAVEFLLDLISDASIMQQDSVLPGEIIHALGQIGDTRAVEPLNALARGNNRKLADRAEVALRILNTGMNPFVRGKDTSDEAYNEVLKEYKGISTGKLIDSLIADNPNKSFLIPLELGIRKAPIAIDALCKNLYGDRVPYDVRLESIIALGKIKDTRAIEPLIDSFDKDWYVKRDIFLATEETLTQLGWKPH